MSDIEINIPSEDSIIQILPIEYYNNYYNNSDNLINCYICLHNDGNLLKMKCCLQPVHEYCLFETFINRYKTCPMCRKNINVKDYFTSNSFKKCVNEMSLYNRCKYVESISTLYGELNIQNIVLMYYKSIFFWVFMLIIYISVVLLYIIIFDNYIKDSPIINNYPNYIDN